MGHALELRCGASHVVERETHVAAILTDRTG